MFPKDFHHYGEYVLESLSEKTWYAKRFNDRSRVSGTPGEIFSFSEVWARNPLVFDVGKAKRILRVYPRLPSFVSVDSFDDDKLTRQYMSLIYDAREDEYPWVNIAVPGMVGMWDGKLILLDGNHRFAKTRRLGNRYFLAYKLTDAEMEMIKTPFDAECHTFDATL